MDRFYPFVRDLEGGYTAAFDHEHADAWMDHLASRDVSATYKCKYQKSLQMLSMWRHSEEGLAEYGGRRSLLLSRPPASPGTI